MAKEKPLTGETVPNEVEELYKVLVKDLRKALIRFGTYSYEDKGATEVMDLPKYTQKLVELDPSGIAWVLNQLYKTDIADGVDASQLISDLLVGLDGHPEMDCSKWGPFVKMFTLLDMEVQDLY